MQIEHDDSAEIKLTKLERLLSQYDFELTKVVPLFANLLSIPFEERYAALNLSPQAQKQKLLEAFLAMAIANAAEQPFILIYEDLHWVDPSTLEFIERLIHHLKSHRILLLCTTRPAFQSPWKITDKFVEIILNPLAEAETEQFIQGLTRGKTLPQDVLKVAIQKSDCIPLFIEEMTKMVLESAWLAESEDIYHLKNKPLVELAIPSSLEDLLMARLDRLDSAKEIAQIAAIIGREFSYELLQAIAPMEETHLQRGLQQLVETQLLFANSDNYSFKHALVQDAAYESLLKSTRKRYHQKIVGVLEEQFPEVVENEPELLAHHCTKASLNREAISYWLLAGQKALQRSANIEAIGHFNKGLELILTLPDTPERIQTELDLQVNLAGTLMATKGYADPEVELAYKTTEELCNIIKKTSQLLCVVWGLWAFYIGNSQYKKALEKIPELLDIFTIDTDVNIQSEYAYMMGWPLLCFGDLIASYNYFKQAVNLYNPQQPHPSNPLTWQDPYVRLHSIISWNLWHIGYPEQAIQYSDKAMALADKLAHPYTESFALGCGAISYNYCRKFEVVKQLAERTITLTTEQGFVFFTAWGMIMHGWAATQEGEVEEGIAQMHQGLAVYRATGAELLLTYILSLLAEGYLQSGQPDTGLNTISEALAQVEKTGERLYESELYRLKGELLQCKGSEVGQQSEVEACFEHALEVSRHQGAKSLELRASMSLARLWQRQGKVQAAQALLSEIYGWFTEGFDTLDLQEAKALLEELGQDNKA